MKQTKWFRKLFLRRALIILAILAQAWLMVDVLLDLSRWLPLFCGLLYLLFSFQSSTRQLRREIEKQQRHRPRPGSRPGRFRYRSMAGFMQ